MESNLRGLNCKVYPYTFTDVPSGTTYNKQLMLDIIANGTPFDYFLAVPETTQAQTNHLPQNAYLYDAPSVPTLPATFNQTTATLFDDNLTGWQLQSLLYYVSGDYSGAVNTAECISLFPNALNISAYMDNTDFQGFVFHFPDVEFAYSLRRSTPTVPALSDLRLYDLLGNSTTQTALFPALFFTPGTRCRTIQTGYVTGQNRFFQYNSTIYDATSMANNVLYLNRSAGNTVPESFFRSLEPDFVPPVTEDPYAPGGETGPGGGEGDFDGTSEDVEFPDDPVLSAVDTGFLTLFNPSLSQLNDLANFMWGSVFDIENWKKLFANPMDAILGLSMVPVSVPNGGTSTVKVGNIDTGVSMTKAAKQYVNVDCGTLNIKEYWGAYLDYSPYTKAEIFLPFIGTHEISVDDVMKKAVHVKYKVDILSGACVANIKCGGSVLYSYSGQCAATIPITGRDWTQTLSAALSVAGNVLSIAASQGMTAPMAATNIAQSAVNAIKPNIQKTGNIGGMAGIMGIQKPYIILTRPRQAVPKNQNKYTGYPSFITAKLSKCDGYTEVEKIHLDSTSATQDEIKELETLLDKGVIF